MGKLDIQLETKMNESFPWMLWDVLTDRHHIIIDKLVSFYEIHKEGPIHGGVRENEKTLSNWISARRKDNKQGTLSPELKRDITDKCPWISWDPYSEAHITRISELKQFYEKFKEPPKGRGTRLNENTLSSWMTQRRKDKINNTLDADIEKLIAEHLPWFEWTPTANRHSQIIAELHTFYETYKDTPTSGGSRQFNESVLAQWMTTRRNDKKHGKLDTTLEKQINERLPWFPWSPIAETHFQRIGQLHTFYKEFKCEPTLLGKRENEHKLFNWLRTRRSDKQNGKLENYLEKIICEKFPWIKWNPLDHLTRILDIKHFYEINGDYPKQHGTKENETTFAHWLCNRRREKQEGTIITTTEQQINDHLPWFSWDPIADACTTLIAQLKCFYETYHRPPTKHGVIEGEAQLANWMGRHRKAKKDGKLDLVLEKQINDALPWFVW